MSTTREPARFHEVAEAVEVLTREALTSVRALGEAMASLPSTRSPQAARATQARDNVYRAAAARHGMLTATEVGQLLGSRSRDAARNLAGRRHSSGTLLRVRHGSTPLYPGFQFEHARPRPVVERLRAAAETAGWSEDDLFLWLMRPTTRLAGAVPADVLDDAERVRRALDLDLSVDW